MLCAARCFVVGPDAQAHFLSACLEPGQSGSGVPLDDVLEGPTLRDFASITPGLARSYVPAIIFVLWP